MQQNKAELAALHPENRHKGTDTPTAERLLKAFSGISFTLMKDAAGREVKGGLYVWHRTDFSRLSEQAVDELRRSFFGYVKRRKNMSLKTILLVVLILLLLVKPNALVAQTYANQYCSTPPVKT